MSIIDLSSIQNKNIKPMHKKPFPEKTKEKPIKNPINQTNEKPLRDDIPEKLDAEQRMKKIKVLELYKMEFPDKLKGYKSKFDNMTDKELCETHKQFQYQVSTTNNLTMATEASKKALLMYEYVCCNMFDINIQGISKLGESDEFRETIKAICLQYIDSPISHVDPVNKALFMVISNSLILHQVNSMNAVSQTEGNTQQPLINNQQPSSQQNNSSIADNMTMKLEMNRINNIYSDL